MNNSTMLKVAVNYRGLLFTRNPNQFFNKVIAHPKYQAADVDGFRNDLFRHLSHLSESGIQSSGISVAGSNAVLLRPGPMQNMDRIGRRSVTAHEAFHARHPRLGNSELLAHAYGGWKAPLPGSSPLRRIASAAGSVRHYLSPDVQSTYRYLKG